MYTYLNVFGCVPFRIVRLISELLITLIIVDYVIDYDYCFALLRSILKGKLHYQQCYLEKVL